MVFDKLGWFQRNKKEKEEAQRVVLDEFQGLRKLLRKQSVLIEEVHREQEALAAREHHGLGPLLDLCDSVFYLHRAFHNPGLMSRHHAQVLNMVLKKMDRFAASLGVKIVLDEGVPFDPRMHEAVTNRDPGSPFLEVLEMVQPGYLQGDKVLRPAKVVVGATGESV